MSKFTFKAALAAAALSLPMLAGTGGEAAAQGATACASRMFVNSIYTNGVGQNQFEYFIQVQNRSAERRTVTLTFSGMPHDVTLFSATLPNIPLNPYQQETIRFGRGTSTNNLTLGVVQVATDGPAPSGRPAVRLTNCGIAR